jgi:carbon starvation protein CstA
VKVLGQWRVDSLSLGSWLLWVYGVQLGAWYSASIGIVAAAATALLLRNAERLHAYVASSCMGLFVLFLLGKQGFLNYYMLVSGLLLLLLATALDQPTLRRMSKDV